MSDSEYRQDSAIEVGEFARDVLGGHPLSIKMVARYGRSVPLPLEDLRRLWEEKWGAIAAGEPTALDDRGLRASFELTFESLPQTARLLFLALGLLPDGLPSVLVKQVWAETETDIYDALRILRDRSLLEEMQSFSTKVNRLRGPLFHFASAKLGEFEQSESQINESVFNARTKIDQWFDHYIAANAPQFGDNDPSTKNQLIREQFHNIHASLDRRLAPSTDPATLAAAQGVLSLYWAYHNNLSGARNPISSTEDAISYLEKAQSIFVGNGLSSDAIRCTYYIGNINWLRGEIPKAHSYLQEAQGSADVSEEISFEIQRAFAHIEYKEGDIRVAVDKYKAVAKLADGISLGCVFRCWVGLLDAYRKLDQLDSAFDLVTLIEPRMAECPAEVVGNLKRGHAYLLASAGRFDEAAEVYKLAITSFSHNAFGQAHCWRGQGDIHVRKQEYDQAANAFAAALRLYDEARKNPSLGVALVILGQGRLDLSQGNVSSALHRFGAAAQMLDREHLNEPYEFAVAHELIGDAYAASGDKERASAEFGISISYFSKVGAIAVADRIKSKIA